MTFGKGIEEIQEIIETAIHKENTKNGLLEDVTRIITTATSSTQIEDTLIWINSHPCIPSTNWTSGDTSALNQRMYFDQQFSFICSCKDSDIALAEKQTVNLASRVVRTINKNVQRGDKDTKVKIQLVTLNAIIPASDFEIEGKAQGVPATEVLITFTFLEDWMNCEPIKEEKTP